MPWVVAAGESLASVVVMPYHLSENRGFSASAVQIDDGIVDIDVLEGFGDELVVAGSTSAPGLGGSSLRAFSLFRLLLLIISPTTPPAIGPPRNNVMGMRKTNIEQPHIGRCQDVGLGFS